MRAEGPSDTAIATWFVADTAEEATYFPQVGARSDNAEAQATYLRCAAVFFASSRAVNPAARHVLFTNDELPAIGGVDMERLLASWGVETIAIPLAHRLPPGSVASWGNQFYVCDIVDHVARNPLGERLVLLDCDCVWRKPVSEMAEAIDRHGALTYLLGEDEYPYGQSINGLSREGMARFLARHGGPGPPTTPYFGGEIFAARQDVTERISQRIAELWPAVHEQTLDAPREEAHLLSIAYALEGIESGTANGFIRRMWTSFRHHNLRPEDAELAVWHLPAEKRTGFADLFRFIAEGNLPGETDFRRMMGFPRRSAGKCVRDLSRKLRDWARR